MNFNTSFNRNSNKTSNILDNTTNTNQTSQTTIRNRVKNKGTYSSDLFKIQSILNVKAFKKIELLHCYDDFFKTFRKRIRAKKVENQDRNAIFKFMTLMKSYNVLSFRESLLLFKK